MSELKTMPLRFRVWDEEKGAFLDYGGAKVLSLWALAELLSDYSSGYYCKNLIVSQDTGLVGRNGEHIFTGDTIKVEYTAGGLGANGGYREIDCEATGVVAYDNLYGLYIEDGGERWYLDNIVEDPEENITLLGNIWQNSELLTEPRAAGDVE